MCHAQEAAVLTPSPITTNIPKAIATQLSYDVLRVEIFVLTLLVELTPSRINIHNTPVNVTLKVFD